MFWRTAEVGTFAIGFAVAAIVLASCQHFVDTRPSEPDELSGRIHALPFHGRTVYVSTREELGLIGLISLSAVGIGGGIVIDAWQDPFGEDAPDDEQQSSDPA